MLATARRYASYVLLLLPNALEDKNRILCREWCWKMLDKCGRRAGWPCFALNHPSAFGISSASVRVATIMPAIPQHLLPDASRSTGAGIIIILRITAARGDHAQVRHVCSAVLTARQRT